MKKKFFSLDAISNKAVSIFPAAIGVLMGYYINTEVVLVIMLVVLGTMYYFRRR
jgi:1,4-dihydroxy-2-naphthoate octaprenyltransferase